MSGNPFFPNIEPPRRETMDLARVRRVLVQREAQTMLKHRAEIRAAHVTGSVTGVVAYLVGVTVVWLLAGSYSIWALWASALVFALITAIRLPVIRRNYLRDLGQISAPASPESLGDDRGTDATT